MNEAGGLRFTGTAFPDIKGIEDHPVDLPWSRFVARLRDARRPPVKAQSPVLCLATFGDRRTPAGALRHDENVLQVTGAPGDYDAGEVSLDEAHARLTEHGIRAVLTTTWSHTPEHPRWRVFAPSSEPLPPSEHRHLVAGLNGALGGILGRESFTLSRGYYVGGRPGGEYRVLVTDGVCIDEWDGLDEVAVYPSTPTPVPSSTWSTIRPESHGSRYIEAAVRSECSLLATAAEGSRNETLNRAAYSLARFVAEGEADPDPIIRELAVAAAHTGLPQHEIARTIGSAFRARGAT